MIKIMIAEDQALVLNGLKALMDLEPDIHVVGTANQGQVLLTALEAQACDVVVMDIQMPIMNGVEATRVIKDQYPQVKVLILTTFADDDYVVEALRHGASGYLLKDTPPAEIAQAIRTVHAGDTILDQKAAHVLVDQLSSSGHIQNSQASQALGHLTEREGQILALIAQGMNNKEIGETLFITEGTVKNNITKMLMKLDLRDRTQLAIFAVKNGLA